VTYKETCEEIANLYRKYVPGTNGLDKLIISFEKDATVVQVHQRQRSKYCTFYEFYPDSTENGIVWQQMIDWLEGRRV